jgi:hypothetical protein
MKLRTFCTALFVATTMAACDGGGSTTDGTGGTGGASGASGAAGTDSSCPTQTSATVANHIIVAVSWEASLGLEAGEGDVHIWTKADLDFDNGTATGKAQPCGSVIPELTKKMLVGGGKVQTQIPDEVWEAMTMPKFDVNGMVSGFGVGATISMDPIASAVGAMLANPATDPWPAKGSEVMTVDHDGDMKPGIKAVPRTDGEFDAPPLDAVGATMENGDRADEVYIATRTVIQLEGKRDSCTSAKGTANVTKLDSHVVGCHVKGKDECTAAQSDFIDGNQPVFTIKSATYEMVQVDKGATCKDVRDALPVK